MEGGRVASDGRGLDPRQRVVVLYSSIHNVGWQRQGLEMPRGTLGVRSHVTQPGQTSSQPGKISSHLRFWDYFQLFSFWTF